MGILSRLKRLFDSHHESVETRRPLTEAEYVEEGNSLLALIRHAIKVSEEKGESIRILELAREFYRIAWNSFTSARFDTAMDACVLRAAAELRPVDNSLGQEHNVLYITSGLLSNGGITQLLLNLLERHDRNRFHFKVFSTEQFGVSDLQHGRVKKVMSLVDVDFVSDPLDLEGCIDETMATILDSGAAVIVHLLSPLDVVSSSMPALFPRRGHVLINASHHVTCVGSFQYDALIDIIPTYYEESLAAARNAQISYISLAGRINREEGGEIVPADLRSRLELHPDTKLSMTIGNPQKCLWGGDHSYGEAVALSLVANPSWHHILVADGMQTVRSSILDFEPSLADRVHCLPSTPHILPVLKAADLYINSYPVVGGLSILDVMSVDRPAVFGPLDLSWFGLTEFTATDGADFKEKVNWMMTDEVARKRCVDAAAQVYDDLLDPAIMCEKYEELYAQVKSTDRAVKGECRVDIVGKFRADLKSMNERVQKIMIRM